MAPYDYEGPGGQLPDGVQMALVAWHRLQIVRLTQPGGRVRLHESVLVPDDRRIASTPARLPSAGAAM